MIWVPLLEQEHHRNRVTEQVKQEPDNMWIDWKFVPFNYGRQKSFDLIIVFFFGFSKYILITLMKHILNIAGASKR